ncbi:MAG: lysoplasmalogenase [Candidatus Aminicenantales bacterium]
MTAASTALLGAAAAFSILAVAAEGTKHGSASRVFRPAAMVAIILLAAARPAAFSETHRLLIGAGLGVALVGDILMMLPKKKFLAGLIAFLVTHLFYSAGILQTMAAHVEFSVAMPVLIGALFVLRTLFPHLGPMKAPVSLYILVLAVMVCLAGQRYIDVGGSPALFAVAGAILFAASDTILAFNRFVRKIPFAQGFILGTYFAAQIFFALSV